MSKPENPPAFPVAWPVPNSPEPGMTLRDWFAGQALAGIIAGFRTDTSFSPEHRPAVTDAYKFADAMLAERSK